jgi:FXSXX-COOH protein
MDGVTTREEPALVDVTQISLDDVRSLDDSVLAHALRRFQHESQDEQNPIVAFGAFNQHGSSPW